MGYHSGCPYLQPWHSKSDTTLKWKHGRYFNHYEQQFSVVCNFRQNRRRESGQGTPGLSVWRKPRCDDPQKDHQGKKER